MSSIDLLKDMAEAVLATAKQQAKTKAYDTQAKVVRVQDKTAWVHIPGGVEETPVSLTIAAKPGDTVQIRVGGGRAWMTGNSSAPPTDDKKASEALKKAKGAAATATNFVTDMTDGIYIHPKDTEDDGVRITDKIEIVKGKVSLFKAWIDSGITKVRVGREDSGHTLIDTSGMKVYAGDGSILLAVLGYILSGGIYVPYFTLGGRKSGSTIGAYSVAEGIDLEASGNYAHAEGTGCKATKTASHAEGSGSEATGNYSHAEGRKGKATGLYAHAENFETTASGEASHCGGENSSASGDCSFAHGESVAASGNYSFVGGVGNSAPYEAQTIFGRFASVGASDDLLLIGNGTNASTRSNAMRVKADGRVEFAGAVGSGLSWDSRTAMINAVTGLGINRAYAFYAGSTWSNTAGAAQSQAFGTICKLTTTAWHIMFMCGGSLYKSVFTLSQDGTTGTFNTTLIG